MEDQLYNNLYQLYNNSRTEWSDPVVFTDQRLTPLLNDTTQYDVAITRFSVNGCTALPLFECAIVEGAAQADPAMTPFELTMSVDVAVAAPVDWPITVDNFNGSFSVSISTVPGQRRCYFEARDYTSAADLAVGASYAVRDAFPELNPVPLVFSTTVDGRITCHIATNIGITAVLHFDVDSSTPEPTRSNCARLLGYTTGLNVAIPTGGVYVDAPNLPQGAYTETFTAARTVQWQPERLNIAVPLPPSANGGKQVRSPYYWASTYSHVLRLISETAKLVQDDSSVSGGYPTLASLQGQLNAWYSGTAPHLQTAPPEWSWQNGVIQLNCDANGWGNQVADST